MDEQAFDALAEAGDSAMIIVTTAAEGVRAGCLVGFHTQSSIEPRRYAVWLSKANHTYRAALRAERLAIHFLTTADEAIAEFFGTRTGEDGDKFETFAVTTDAEGVPLLDALPHRMIGRRVAMIEVGGDHALVEIAVDAVHGGAEPFAPLRLASVIHLRPGHEAQERTVRPDR